MYKRVAVLRGGVGDEHDVSLKTGANVLSHLSGRESHRPVDVFIDRHGQWHVRGIPMSPERALSGIDVVWNGLHGQYGEDGTVQRLLDRTGIPYTGSGALPSALAMNKALAKKELEKHGVVVARSKVLKVSPDLEREVLEIFRTFPQPSVVKPVSSGSSVGVTIARSFKELWNGIKRAFQHSPQVMVEEYIVGKEATCGIVDRLRGEDRYGLLPVEIIPAKTCSFFDYEAKYGGGSTESCPGSFSRGESDELKRLARLVHEELGLRHYSRSDFIVSPRGIYFLEANTLPGLTNESLLPKSLAAMGVAMPEFVDHILDVALER